MDKKFSLTFFLNFIFCSFLFALDVDHAFRPPIIMIDPAGHAKNVGRTLVEGFERGETFKFAEALQKALQERYRVRPIISRTLNEEILPLQISSFSNRLGTDFFFRIHMYREETVKPKIFLYHLVFNPLIDWAKKTVFEACYLIPIHRAHFRSIYRTKFIGIKMKEALSSSKCQKYLDCYGLYGIPLKNLVGILAPAILLEIGLCEENKWRGLIKPIVESMSFLDNTNTFSWVPNFVDLHTF